MLMKTSKQNVRFAIPVYQACLFFSAKEYDVLAFASFVVGITPKKVVVEYIYIYIDENV